MRPAYDEAMQPDLELKPATGGRVAMAAGGLVFLAVAVLLAAQQAKSARHAPPLALIVVFGIAAAVLLLLAIRIGHRRVLIDREGIEVRGLFDRKRLAWSDVASYSFVSVDTSAQVAYTQGGLVGLLIVALVKKMRSKPRDRKFAGGRLVLHGRDGSKLAIGPWFRDADHGLERIFAEIHPRLAPTLGAQFGKLAFDGNVLGYGTKAPLTVMEIEKITVSPQGLIVVKKVGKRLPWVSVRMSGIPCSLLLFERLVQHGIFVEMPEAVYVPLPTLGVLTRMATARQNLPQARVQLR